MHLEAFSVNNHKYYRICQSFRSNGKVKKQILATLGRLSTDNMLKWAKILASLSRDEAYLINGQDDLECISSKSLGEILLLNYLWNLWELNGFFDTNSTAKLLKPSKLAAIMVFNRCLDPRSKLELHTWYSHTAMDDVSGVPLHSVDREDNLYEAMDELLIYKDAFEKHIFQHLAKVGILEVPEIFYDLTSSYFEGAQCILARCGYSRDHRADRLQIVIALVTTKEVIPIYHEVFKGNQDDKSSLKLVKDKIKERFPNTRVTFVADRGLGGEPNLELLQEGQYDFVLCLPKKQIQDKLKKALNLGLCWQELSTDLKAIDFREGLLRYVLVENSSKARDDKRFREQQMKKGLGILEKIQQQVIAGKIKKPQTIIRRATKALVQKKIDLYFDYQVQEIDGRIIFSYG